MSHIRSKYVFAILISILITCPAFAAIVTFDDVADGFTVGGAANPLPSPYSTFTWSGSDSQYWGVIGNTDYKAGYSNTFTFPSGQNVVTNEYGTTGAQLVTLSRATEFNLESAFFGTWTQNDITQFWGASSVTLTGYRDGVEIYSPLTISLAPGALTFKNINFFNVDEVRFAANAGTQNGRYFLMDNMTYSNVPVPPAVFLLGTGVIGLIGIRCRRRTK